MSRKILITGAFGFVGSNLSAYLADKGFELWALDVKDSSRILKCESSKVEDCENSSYAREFNWEQLEEIPWADVYAVVHLAGKAHDTKNTSDPQSYFDINTGLTEKVLKAALSEKSGVERFVIFSSVKAVADSIDGVLTEDFVPDPQTPYGQSKLAAEKIVREAPESNSRIRALSHSRTYILRPSMIHGPGNKGNLNLLYNIVQKGIPWPLGSYENQRSFVSIGNVCAVVKGLLDEEVESGVYQVADDDTIATNRLIGLIAESQGRPAKIIRIPKGLISVLAKVGDVLHLPLNSERLKKLTESYVVANAKIKSALGWDSMPVRAEDGMRKTLESFLDE